MQWPKAALSAGLLQGIGCVQPQPQRLWMWLQACGSPALVSAALPYLTAMNSISTLAPRGRAAAWRVERAGGTAMPLKKLP